MPALSSTPGPIKALILADSGLGKTGSLWSLVRAGFKLRIYDADANSGVLAAALRAGGVTPEPGQVEAVPFKDNLKINAQGFASGKPKAWVDFLKALGSWPDNPKEGLDDWGTDTVVVIDTLTSLGRAALQHAMSIDSKFGKVPEIQHYHAAGFQIKDTLSNIISPDTGCHVLVMTHINYRENQLGAMFGLPKAVGDKLSEDIPIFFNTMLALRRAGTKKVTLSTKPTAMVQTKMENFDRCKDEYLLIDDKGVGQPGLAEFFADCGWAEPGD